MTTPATLRKQELLQLLGAIIQRRLVSDYEGLSQYLAEDVVAELPLSRRLFMWAGKHQGLAEVIEALRLIDAEIHIVEHVVRDVIDEGDKLVIRSFRKIANRGSSGVVDIEVSDYFEWRGAELISFIEHFDTEAVLRLVRGEI